MHYSVCTFFILPNDQLPKGPMPDAIIKVTRCAIDRYDPVRLFPDPVKKSLFCKKRVRILSLFVANELLHSCPGLPCHCGL